MRLKCGWAVCATVLAGFVMCCASSAVAATLLVPEDYGTIGDAVAVAVTGDVVSIAPGTYRESVTLNTDGVVLESRGQAATAVSTVITGDNGDGTNRPYVVLCGATTGATTEVRYLTITGASSSTGLRGGIVIEAGSSVLIRDNIITDNSSGGLSPYTGGGGIHCRDGSSPTIRHNTITENFGYWGGGAVYCGVNSTVLIEDNVLNLNDSRYDGGAVRCDPGSEVTIQRNEIVGNDNYEYSSGGIYTEAAMCQILGNYIAENVSGETLGSGPFSRGGGISVERGAAVIANNIFRDNRVPVTCHEYWGCSQGGAIYVNGFIYSPSATIINNTIHHSTAAEGSAVYVGDRVGTVVVRNNIVTSSTDGCALGSADPVDSDFNCLWDNVCDYEGAWAPGPNDLHADPLFVSATPSAPCSFVLQAGSPCIDAGTNVGAPLIDYALNTRPQDGDGDTISVTDIGAFEGSCNTPPVALDDSATTDEDTPVTIAVLANDSDADGDSLTVTSVTDPPSGSAVINADETVTYTPDVGYDGSDSFEYTISDGRGGTDTAAVSITVVAAPELYNFVGFLPPINMPPDEMSVFKQRSTIPVKFRLLDPSTQQPVAGVHCTIWLEPVSSGVPSGVNEPASSTQPDGGNTFRYDEEDCQYIFNLSTRSLDPGVYRIHADIAEGLMDCWVDIAIR
ncbi:MAG: cadherin-like domain-containing protein [Armatimonadota bacterium]|nr:MAG: cadherin-like domain-containing protein [Armatimonadota bacterium]